MKDNFDLEATPFYDLTKYHQNGFDRGRPGWYILWWWLVQSILFPLSPHFANRFRVSLLRLFGATIGTKVVIRPTARFTYPWKITIGDYSWIGDDVVLYSLAPITIGQHTIISQKCYICTGSHNWKDPTFHLETGSVQIGNGVWIATDCFIGPGVIIGSNSVIGARSSIFKSIFANQIAWGNPGRPHYTRVSLDLTDDI